MNSQTVKIIVAVVALGVAAVLFGKYFAASDDTDEGMASTTHWICQNSSCGADFSLTARDMLNFSKTAGLEEGGPPCPSCGKHTTIAAEVCPSCQEPYELGAHGAVPANCPSCNEPLR